MTVGVALNTRGLTANVLLALRVLLGLLAAAAVTAVPVPVALFLLPTGLHLCCAAWGSHPPAVLLLWSRLGSATKAILWDSVA